MTSTRKPRPTLSSSAGLAVLVALTLTLPPAQAQLLIDDSQFWTQETAGIPGESAAGDLFGMSFASGDFNNDGFPDLAIGVPQKTVEVDDGMGGMDTFGNAGEVMVLYGSASRLTATDVQLFTQATADVPGDPAASARFGFALAAADFNNDGFADLAASAITATVNGNVEAGAVVVLNGSPGGLTATGSQLWTQDTPEVLGGGAEPFDLFGISLAAGDFNGDGTPDLAIGIRGEDVGPTPSAGAVAVLYAAAGGLSADGNQFWSQDSPGIAGVPESFDQFGRSLTSGDFNNDSYDDLAIGVPNEDVGALSAAGAVNVIYGSAGGLTATGDQLWTQDSAGIAGTSEAGDLYGFSVREGDFNNDGFGDLAIGVPGEDIGATVGAGAVNVIYGAAGAGLVSAGNQIWSIDLPNLLEPGDDYGRTLAAGDFNNDGFDDLAIGGPLEDVVAVPDAGAVSVLYGSGIGGLTAQGAQSFHQDVAGIADAAEANDRFGGGGVSTNVETTPLATGDFNGDRFWDLVIGVPNEDFEDPDIGTVADSGAFHVLYGGRDLSAELQQALQDLQNIVNQLGMIPIP